VPKGVCTLPLASRLIRNPKRKHIRGSTLAPELSIQSRNSAIADKANGKAALIDLEIPLDAR
jgi:hypothetical protein